MSKPHGERPRPSREGRLDPVRKPSILERCALFRRLLQLVIVALSTIVLPAAVAEAKTVAVFVDGPGAGPMRDAVIRAFPSGIDVVESKRFRAELARAGQKGPIGNFGKAELRRIRRAAEAVQADAVLLVRVRQEKKSRTVRFQIVDVVAEDGPAPESVRLAAKASDADIDAVAPAVGRALEAYAAPAPEATAPEPVPEVPEAPPPPPVVAEAPVAPPAVPIAPVAPPAATKTPAEVLATSVIDIAVAGALVGRHFEYENGISPDPYVYRLRPSPAARVSGTLFPFATTRSLFADLGIEFDYARTFLGRADYDGARRAAAPSSHTLGLRVRIHPGLARGSPRVLLGVSVAYAFSGFGAVGPADAELPEVKYRAVRPSLDARIFFGRFSILGAAAFRAILDAEAISPGFYGPSAYGLDGELGVAFSLTRHFELRIIGRYERYSANFTAPAGARLRSGGAVDQWYGARAALSVIF